MVSERSVTHSTFEIERHFDVHDHVQRRIDQVDTAIYGRVTFDLMES